MKLAVHLHIYYQDMWGELKGYLQNLKGQKYDLFVTMVKKNDKLAQEIKSFKKDATIEVLKNAGYDIWPFLHVIQNINLKKYDYVLKLHTKRNLAEGEIVRVNGFVLRGAEWKDLMFNSLLGSREIVERNFKRMEKDKTIGMIGSRYLIDKIGKAKDLKMMILEELKKLGFKYYKEMEFVAGTMFLVRAELLEPLAKRKYAMKDFEESKAEVHHGRFVHAMERVLGCIMCAQCYEIKGFDKFEPKFYFEKCIFRKKTTKNGKVDYKLFGCPVWSRKL